MYAPTNKREPGLTQEGGAYISNMADPSTLLISSISKETLSTIAWMANISSIANISSYAEISNLSISQIAALIAAVTKQISNEDTTLINTQSQIVAIQSEIDAIPDGYQAKYDLANEQYISTTRAYKLAQDTLANDQSTLSSKIVNLECLSTCSSFYLSSVEGYEKEYSSIWDSIQVNNDIMAKEDAEYKTKLRAYIEYTTNYDIAIRNLESTLHALDFNSSMLSTATYDYYTTSTNYGHLLEDYINFSTHNLSVSQYLFTSTNKHLSSLVDLQSTQLGQYVSTSTARHLADMNVLSAQATLDYRNALSRELSSIIDYNKLQEQLRKLLQTQAIVPAVQIGGTDDINTSLDYFKMQVPPEGRELEYNTLYIMLSTLSTAMFTASNEREELEINQTEIQLVTLKAVLDVADNNISQAQYTYYLAQLNQSSVISTMSGLSTRIGIADTMEDNYLSTLSSLSTVYLNDISTYKGIQDSIETYKYTKSVLDGFLTSTLLTLSMLNEQSTMYNMSIAGYTQSYIGYSTLEGIAQSSINGYSSIKGITLSTMNGLDEEMGSLTGQVGGQFTDLTTNTETFYNNVTTDLNNELDAYKYGIQEWNSFIGYLASELLIQKLNLYTAIDSITFKLQTNITSDEQALLISQRNGYATLQTNIQSIIDKFNVLDVQFANILQEVENERSDKTSFVSTRSILTGYEISVLQDPLKYPVVQSQYIFQIATLNTRVNSINSHILHRNEMMIALYDIINPQLTILEGLNILSYTLPDPIQTNIGPFNIDKTEYELLPQLNYGLNPIMYPLVLTNMYPSTITDLSILPPGLFYTGDGNIGTTTTITTTTTTSDDDVLLQQ